MYICTYILSVVPDTIIKIMQFSVPNYIKGCNCTGAQVDIVSQTKYKTIRRPPCIPATYGNLIWAFHQKLIGLRRKH